MTPYILTLVFVLLSQPDVPHTATHEFKSQEACEAVAAKLKEVFANRTKVFEARCEKK